MNINIYSEANNLIYENVSDFDIDDILLCGQCFHFDKLGDKEYELIAYGKDLHIKQFDNKVISKSIQLNAIPVLLPIKCNIKYF